MFDIPYKKKRLKWCIRICIQVICSSVKCAFVQLCRGLLCVPVYVCVCVCLSFFVQSLSVSIQFSCLATFSTIDVRTVRIFLWFFPFAHNHFSHFYLLVCCFIGSLCTCARDNIDKNDPKVLGQLAQHTAKDRDGRHFSIFHQIFSVETNRSATSCRRGI